MSAPLPASGPPAPTARAPADVLRVVLAYAVFASLWNLLSDTVVHLLVSDPARIVLVSTIKGWLFVAVTTLLLYALIRRLRDLALAGACAELAAQAEKARALQLLAAIADNSSDAIFAKDFQGRYLMVNREVERVVGKTAEEMLGQDDTALFPPQAETIRANDRRVMDENRTTTYEETLATAEGERTFLATKGPLHDAQGQVNGIFGISRDITERHQAHAMLRKSEARYRSLFDNAHVVMLLIDPDGGAIVAANPAAAAFYGYSQQQLQGMRIDQINTLPPAEIAAAIRLAQTQQRKGFEFQHRLADGQLRDVEVFSGPMQMGDRQLLFSVVHDIGARNRIAAQLADSEALRRSELSASVETQQQSRLAALRLMEEALTAKCRAESLGVTLNEQLDELRRWQLVTLGREGRILAMKKEVNELLAAQGQPPRYPSVVDEGAET
jgi:PAS domain S-box-containing protein